MNTPKPITLFKLFAITFFDDEVIEVATIRTCNVTVSNCPQLTHVIQTITNRETNLNNDFDPGWIIMSQPDLEWIPNHDGFHDQFLFAVENRNNIMAVYNIDADESDTYVVIRTTVGSN